MKSVAFHNLGCKVNSYEMDVMQQIMKENGYIIVPFDEIADIYVVNTCTVTNIADRKSRQMLHRAKQKNPNAIVVAVGCYVQTDPAGVERDECIDLAIGNNKKKELARILDEFIRVREQGGGDAENIIRVREQGGGDAENVTREESGDESKKYYIKTLGETTVIDINKSCGYEKMSLKTTSEHTRAYIKIQDGCNQFCSYCIIPYARGRVRSRDEEDILEEVRRLAEAGFREIVLTGIHISSYGVDWEEQKVYSGESRLIDLVERIHREVPKLMRIRLGSLEPRVITRETAARLAALPKLCPHFHLSLQSGCDETLKRMNRRYTTGEYLQGVEILREAFDEPAITTDVIVGFPGETGEEFAQTKAFLEKVGFFEMHIFKYSRRKGTRADKMPGQLTEREKAARSDELFAIEAAQSKGFRERYIGKKVKVLWESRREIEGDFYWLGHTMDYVKVALPAGEEDLENRLFEVVAEGFLTQEILLGKHV